MKSTNLYKEAERRANELGTMMERVVKQIEKAPNGKMRFIQRNGNVQYYLRSNPQDIGGEYVRKSETGKIKEYLQKAYNSKILKAMENELKCLKTFLEKSNGKEKYLEDCYSTLPEEVKQYISPIAMSDDDYAKMWSGITYEGKNIIENQFTQKTDLGEIVRSKSERAIANHLHKMGIPYKYECPLKLKSGNIIYPDFTILNVRERKVYYWEHRGMMDDREYTKNAVLRNKEYMRSGIFLGTELIITEETSMNQLGTDEIKAVIKKYLL